MNKFKKNNVTIAQVAIAADVSRTTVSRYLNGKFDYMSADTRQRIQDIIEQMDYHPSNIARSLKSQKSKSIGCIIADISNPFSSILLKGINDVCNSSGYQVLFSNIDDQPEKELTSIQELLNSQVDGLIVNTTGCNDNYLIELKNKGLPIVLADRCIAPQNMIDTVTTENYHSTYACMRHLFESGFQKIAFFTPGNGKISPRIIRYQAYMDAMKDFYGMDGSQLSYAIGENSAKGCENQLAHFIQNNAGERLAIFCVNGVTLINVLQAMQLVGCSISANLGVCGFDDWDWAPLIPPGITTIAKDSYSIGMEAARILIKRITNERKVKPVFIELESRVCIRGSTNPELAAKFTAWKDYPGLKKR
nr:LacI family DNA-binding transcriptional regulator [uncultured Caproiciproducens sp.]